MENHKLYFIKIYSNCFKGEKKIIFNYYKKLTIGLFVFLFIFSSPGLLLAVEEATSDNSQSSSQAEASSNKAEQTTSESSTQNLAESETSIAEEGIDGGFAPLGKGSDPEFGYERKPIENKPHLETDNTTGALIYSYPLTVPPGRNGLQPDLKLIYNSQSDNNSNLFGYGWSTNIPYIERINREGVEDLYSKNYYYSSLSGELEKITSDGGGEKMGAPGKGNGDSSKDSSPELNSAKLLNQELAYTAEDGSVLLYSPQEQVNLRTINSKTYITGYTKEDKEIYKGLFYPGEIHYFSQETAQFEDIDTRLINYLDGWDMNKASYSATLASELKDSFIIFKNQGQEFYFSLLDYPESTVYGTKTIFDEQWSNKQAVYKDGLGKDIDIAISLNNEALIKEAVINNLDALGDLTDKEYYEVSFKLSSNNAIDLKAGDKLLSKQGIITTSEKVEIVDDKGITSCIWPPKAQDSSNSINSVIPIEIEYKLTEDGIIMTKKLPVEWLKNAKYPVRTDATVSYFTGAGDGHARNTADGWDATHDAATGSGANYTLDATSLLYLYINAGANEWIYRGFFPTYTASLPDTAIISSSSLWFYITGLEEHTITTYAAIVTTTQANTSQLTTADYDQIGITDGGNKAIADMAVSAYNFIPLNATALDWISKTGTTTIGVRYLCDLNDANPGNGDSNVVIRFSEYSGTDYDPYLEIDYTTNSAPIAPIDLETEGQTNPTSVTDTTPEFTAIYNDPDSGDIADNYQIQVSSTSTNWTTSLVWDSEKTALASSTSEGNRIAEISYGSSTPLSVDGSTYYWRIKFWDDDDDEGAWSSGDDYFTMNSAPTAPTSLEVEEFTNPINITDTTPEFTAIYNDPDFGDQADYYQIQVATSTDNFGVYDFWDSTKTALASSTAEGNRCEEITYSGNSLADGTIHYWRIKFWDDEDNVGAWSSGDDFFNAGDDYGAKVDNGGFLKYQIVDNEYWAATDKNGTVYTFGQATTTRQYDKNNNNEHIYKWMLEETRDANDNYIKYEYFYDNGQIYPSKIIYTGNGATDGIFEIEFSRESRNDVATSTQTGFEVTTYCRINEIKAEINDSEARKYELGYTTGDNGVRSMLNTITETGTDEQSNTTTLPTDILSYQTAIKSWTGDGNYSDPLDFVSGSDDTGARIADVNGDGLVDLLIGYEQGGGSDIKTVYINNGDGTGWADDDNYTLPFCFVDSGAKDKGNRLADVNGDGLVDLFHNGSAVYINDGDGTGWTHDESYSVPVNFVVNNNDTGARLADVNGDGLVDILNNSNVYINDGDGTGWTVDTNYSDPFDFVSGSDDNGARIADVNGDGLVDLLIGYEQGGGSDIKTVYINNGDGTGWADDDNYTLPFCFVDSGAKDKGNRLADVNGDGLVDLFHNGSAVYINDGDGTGWTHDESYSVPVAFISSGSDTGARLADVNGDGLVDILNNSTVYINDGEKADLLNYIKTNKGAEINIYHKGSAEYLDGSNNILNPDLPFSLQTVYQIVRDDGLGNVATTTYEYEEGDYYYSDEYDRKLAGFGKIVKTNDLGYVTNTYYHQGNDSASTTGEYSDDISKLGKIYRIEIYDDSDNLYSKTINKWDNYDLGDDRDFVSLIQAVEFSYDGDEDHKDKATTYIYEDTYGNLTGEKFWGEVNGSDDGSFSDTGSDIASSTISYVASSTPYIVGLASQEIMYDQNSAKVKETKYYYDDLSLGNVDYGNLTKQEVWKSGSDYIDIEMSYNSYGLVTQEKDPRDKTTNYTYDEYNLHIATSTNPLSHEVQYYYDYSLGQPKQITDPNSRVYQTTYDGLDRVIEEKQPDLTTPTTLVTKTAYTYYDLLNPRSIHQTNNLDGSTSYDIYTYLDGFDRVVQERKEAEAANTFSIKDYSYNELGLLEIETLPYFSTGTSTENITTNNLLYNIYSYDPLQRITTIVNAVGTTTNAYDQWVLTITDAESNSKDLTKDAYDNLAQVDEYNDSSTYTTQYEYDLLGNLTKITDALSNERSFTYDALSRMTNSEDLHTIGDSYYASTTLIYDDSGNLTQKIDGKNQTIDYTYDDISRVLAEDYLGVAGTEVEYGYDWCSDGTGRLCSATTTNAVTEYSYYGLGLVNTETRTINSTDHQTEYSYDRQGNITQITLPDDSQAQYTYNTAGLVETVAQKEQADAGFTNVIDDLDYNAMEQVIYKNFSNSTETYLTYDPNELYRLANITTTGPQTGGGKKMGAPGGDDSGKDGEKIYNTPVKDLYLEQSLAYENNDGSTSLYNPEEQINKRTRNSKTYLIGWNKDNKEAYKGNFYPGEIHYFNKNTAQFEDIDTTLVDHFDGWTMDKAAYSVSILSELKDDFVEFENQGQELNFSLISYPKTVVNASKTIFDAQWSNKQVIYKDALEKDIDIAISLNNEALIKEAVINNIESLGDLTGKEYYEIQFKLTSNNNIDIKAGDKLLSKVGVITTSEKVEIIDNKGITSYIWNPVARDSSNEINNSVNIDIEYKLTPDGIILIKKLPVEWLKQAKYPIRTDATVSYFAGTGDGYVGNYPSDTNWDNVHDASTGTSAGYTETYYDYSLYLYKGGDSYAINRVFFPVDTSGLPDTAVISSSTMYFYVTTKEQVHNDNIDLVETTQATSSLTTADFDEVNSVEGGTTAYSNITINQYNSIALNSTAKSWISKTGWTKLGLRYSKDTDDIEPTNWGADMLGFRYSDYTGTSSDPYLEIEYTENSAPTAPTDLETEGQTNPVSVTDTTPEFTAIYNDPDSGDAAIYYQIQVSASSTDWSELMWDSTKTALASSTAQGNRCEEITYNGDTLVYDGSTYYWRIKFWDSGSESVWSTETASFTISSPLSSDLYVDCHTAQSGQTNPTGLRCGAPMLSATYQSLDKSANKYQIQVNTQSDFAGTSLWDSGSSGTTIGDIVDNARSWDIAYRGDPLTFATSTYYWHIKFWDSDGNEGEWNTATSTFGTANLNVLQDLHYSYDSVGNITQIVDSSDLNGAKTIEFEYDDLYRLTQASSTNAVSGGDYLRTYAYNAIGNINNKSDQGDYYYTGNQGTNFANPHAVTDIASTTYSYDNNGNLTSDSIWTHSWDYRNRLTNSENGSSKVYYIYDHDINRVTYSDATATTTYANKYYNISNTGTSTKHIFLGNQVIATVEGDGTSTSTYYIHTDHLTGSNVISDSTGSKEQLVDYYPFGEMRINEKESSFNEQRKFTGHEYDKDAGLNYMMARYYDGGVGRFISVDPMCRDIGGDLSRYNKQIEILLSNPQELNTRRTTDKLNSTSEFNLRKNTPLKNNLTSIQDEYLANPQRLNSYSYCRNNPLIYTDPSGETEFHFSFTTNAGLGGSAGNTWSFGFATDGTYGSSVSWQAGGFAGGDASIGVSIGYSNADTWSDTAGKNYYVTAGGKIIVVGGGANVNFSESGEYSGVDIGGGVGPSSPVYMGGGTGGTTILSERSIKQDFQNIKRGVASAVNSTVDTLKQGGQKIINFFSKK